MNEKYKRILDLCLKINRTDKHPFINFYLYGKDGLNVFFYVGNDVKVENQVDLLGFNQSPAAVDFCIKTLERIYYELPINGMS